MDYYFVVPFAFDDKFTVTAADTTRIDDDTPTTTINTNKNKKKKKKKETKATLKTPIDADVGLSNKNANTTTGTTGEEEQEVPIPPGNFDIDGKFTTSNTTEEKVEKSSKYYDNSDNEILLNESNPTTAMITENQMMPTIIEDEFNEEEPNSPTTNTWIDANADDTPNHTDIPITTPIEETTTATITEIATETTTTEDKEVNDNIDQEILRNEESTIVFEDASLAPTTVRTDNPNTLKLTHVPMVIEQEDKAERVPLLTTNHADIEHCSNNVTTTTRNNNINTVQQLAEEAGQESKWVAARAQREADRVDRARVHKEEMVVEQAKREENRVDRARVRKEQRTRRLELIQVQKQRDDEQFLLKRLLTSGTPPIEHPPAHTTHICSKTPLETVSATPNNKFKQVSDATNSITTTSSSNKYHAINLQVAHQNTVSYDKWRQQQEQQREQTLQQQNAYWDAECYRQIAAANKEANRTYDECRWGSNTFTHQTIPPTTDWSDDDWRYDESHEYNNKYDDDNIEYDFEDNNEDDEYDSDNQMYTTNNTIDSVVDTPSIRPTPIHTTVITDMNPINMNTTTEIPTLIQPTNTIIKSSIFSKINIIEDDNKNYPINSIKDLNAAKKKAKALRRQKAANIRRTENTIQNKWFDLFDQECSSDTNRSSSECNCDLHHECPKYRWEHWSQRTFSYDKTYNYDKVDPVETYMLDGQDHWYFNTYIPRMLGGFMPH